MELPDTAGLDAWSSAGWRKSTRSNATNECVECAVLADEVGVRDSKNRGSGMLVFGRREWTRFLQGVKAGEFDSV